MPTSTPRPPVKRAQVKRSPKAVRPAEPTGTFARLKAQAAAASPEVEPYVIEDVDPPIVIAAPDTAEQQLALAEFFGYDGQFQVNDARRILETICGPSFAAVWELVRQEKLPVLLALIQDMGRHFEEQGAFETVDEEDVPGGTSASSV